MLKARTQAILIIIVVIIAAILVGSFAYGQAPPETRIHPHTFGTQYWPRGTVTDSGDEYWSWRDEGSTIRGLMPDGRVVQIPQPGCGSTGCNKGENESRAIGERVLFVWSDFTGRYGAYMGCIGRLFEDGWPIGDEFPVISNPRTGWRPLVAEVGTGPWSSLGFPSGNGMGFQGWAVVGTIDWAEETGLSLIRWDGSFVLNSLQVNSPQWAGASQNYAAVTETADGVLVLMRDCGAAHAPAGCGLTYRLLRPDLTWASVERAMAADVVGGDEQREARVAMWRRGGYVTWTQRLNGSWEIYACRILHNGRRVGPSVRVNQQIGGQQFDPEIAVDGNGTAWIVWDDRGLNAIMTRGLDASGQFLGDAQQVNALPLGPILQGEFGRRTPTVSFLADGRGRWAWSGASQVAGGKTDCYVRDAYPWDL